MEKVNPCILEDRTAPTWLRLQIQKWRQYNFFFHLLKKRERNYLENQKIKATIILTINIQIKAKGIAWYIALTWYRSFDEQTLLGF